MNWNLGWVQLFPPSYAYAPNPYYGKSLLRQILIASNRCCAKILIASNRWYAKYSLRQIAVAPNPQPTVVLKRCSA